MDKINLLFIITKLELGGAQKQLLSLIRHLNKERFNIFLFTSLGLLDKEAQAISGLTLYRSRYLKRTINPLKDLLALCEIRSFIKNNQIQILHTHSSKAGILGRLAGRLAGVKIILHTVHGWSFNDFQPVIIRKLFISLERLAARFTHKIIVVSDYDLQKGLRSRIGSPDKYTLIRYGIDYSEFHNQKDGLRREFGIGESDPLIGSISCFKPQKSVQDFIKSAFLMNRVFPDAKFILVGDGVLRGSLERLIKKYNLGGKIILTGWRSDIPRILSAIDVFVLTSLWEGLPISVLEAMASSKPVVATNTGGIAEVVVENKTGFLVRPKDRRGLCEKLNVLLKDRSLRDYIGGNARQSLGQDFDIKNTAEKTHCTSL